MKTKAAILSLFLSGTTAKSECQMKQSSNGEVSYDCEMKDEVELYAGNKIIYGSSKLYLTGWCNHAGSYTQWADLNGDGKADIICDDSHGQHWIQYSTGPGTFRNCGQIKTGWCSHGGSKTSWADVDGDGNADMICDDTNGTHWIQLSNGSCGFKKDLGVVKTGWCSHAGSKTSWADVNGDGLADMICDDSQGTHWVNLSNGNGSFTNWGVIKSGWCSHSGSTTRWADVNGDGLADMICDDLNGRHWIQLSTGQHDKPFIDLGQVKTGWCSHGGSDTQWADVNGDGKSDMICDDTAGRHWYQTSHGYGEFMDLGMMKTGWCSHAGSYTQYADINGNGNADMLCDDSHGNHWYYIINA